jgi:hypothetical protein
MGEKMCEIEDVEQAFVCYMHDRTIDGQPRTSLRYSTYETYPLSMMADKLLFILTYLKQNLLQEIQGQLFGMSQSNANNRRLCGGFLES